MSAARVVDGARATACWTVMYGDTERNFPTKARAIAWLRAQNNDTRIHPVVQRHDKGAYTYYGPGEGGHVTKAQVFKVSFASVRARAAKPLFSELSGDRA